MRCNLILLCILLSNLAQSAFSQEVSHAWTVGVGASNIYEEYLSPLEYRGLEARIQWESMRPTHLLNNSVHFQSVVNVHGSYGNSRSKSGKMYEGLFNWNLAWLYQWPLNDRWTVLAGPMLDINAGIVYNSRNSNNPAQAKIYLNADASGMVYYRFRMFNHPFRLRYQVAVPLTGLMFSPNYAESYYEMFGLGNAGGHNICLTTPISQPSLRHSLYLDFTWSDTNIRIGYVGDMMQCHVNNLHSHYYSHACMIGIIRNFTVQKKPIQ